MKLYDSVYLARSIHGFPAGTRCAVVEVFDADVVWVEVLDDTATSCEDNERRVFEIDVPQLSAAPVPAAA